MSFDRERDRGQREGGDSGDVAAPAWRRADRALRALARRRAALDVEEARWLLEARAAEVHVHLGLGSFVEYCERVLGYRPRTTMERVRPELSDSDAIVEICEDVLAGGRSAGAGPRQQIAITQCADCKRAWQDGGGQVVEVAPAVIDAAACDAPVLDLRAPETTVSDAIPRAVRNRVLRRDHHRCTVPGCRSARHLDVHHLVPRALGGDHTVENLTVLCGAHHRALHAGRLRIEGRPPDLRFAHVDGRPHGAVAEPSKDAIAALRQAGFSATVARDAVARASPDAGRAASLEDLLRHALRHAAALTRSG